jgi:tRNA(Ile2) C34 agmatinyltransferase TiaS
MTAELTVERCGDGYAVYRGWARVRGPFTNKDLALSALSSMERTARLKSRACLCCGGTFDSEGPHNRMCNSCRRQTEPYAGVVGTQGRRVRRMRA